jgi:hypothetical protein
MIDVHIHVTNAKLPGIRAEHPALGGPPEPLAEYLTGEIPQPPRCRCACPPGPGRHRRPPARRQRRGHESRRDPVIGGGRGRPIGPRQRRDRADASRSWAMVGGSPPGFLAGRAARYWILAGVRNRPGVTPTSRLK